ncbi:MAG TPA: hypothetical protein VHV10_21575, partial [Ktedonobacteraceae bacterium]|nr:hypothetical protein [Ktedonobacteraceae bacterium]
MRTTIVTPKQRVLATLVKWTSLFLILLAVMAGTISGELPIGRTNFSRTAVPSGPENRTCPDASPDQTPTPFHGDCAYNPTANNGRCVSPYILQDGLCHASPIPSGGSSTSFCIGHETAQFCVSGAFCFRDQTIPGCTVGDYCTTTAHPTDFASCGGTPTTQAPNIQSPNACPQGFEPIADPTTGGTECHLINGTPDQVITPSCAPHFVYIKGQCFSNQTFDLIDTSTGNCTLTPQGEEGEGSGEE